MNDDLHNIDDFLRDRIEGHEETVPDSAWDTVSNDLDKKQVSYYRNKYYQLKWVALVLLLLCFSGGSYFVYEGLKKHTAQAPQNAETGLRTVPHTAPEEKGKSENAVTTHNKKSIQENTSADIQKDGTLNNAGFDSTNTLSSKNLSSKKAIDVKTKTNVDNPAVVFDAPLHPGDQKQFPDLERSLLKKKDKQKKDLYANSNPSLETPFASSPYFYSSAITGKDYNASFIQRQPLIISRNFILPLSKQPVTIKNKTSATHSLSLTVFAAPNASFNRLEDDDHLAGPGGNRHEAHQQEHDNVSFTGGLLLNYGLLKNLSIQSGVTVTSSSTAIDAKTIYASPDNSGHTRYELHCSSGNVYLAPKGSLQPAVGDSAKALGTRSRITYVSIPAAVTYHLGSGRFSFYPSIGVGLNILAGSNASTNLAGAVTNEKVSSSISGLKPTYMDGQIGFGVEYSLNKKLSIGLRPNARLALTSINQETPVKSYQNFLSIETGVRLKF